MIIHRETGNFMHCSWECKMVQTLWLLKQLNIQLPYDSAIPLLSIYINTKVLKGGTWTDICMPMLTATLFTTAKRWKQTKCPFVDEQRSQMWYRYTTQYCSAMRWDENLIFAIPWMDFKKFMLIEVSQTQKATYFIISLIWNIQNRQINRTRLVIAED